MQGIEFNFFLLCDFINITQENKPNIIGLFDRIVFPPNSDGNTEIFSSPYIYWVCNFKSTLQEQISITINLKKEGNQEFLKRIFENTEEQTVAEKTYGIIGEIPTLPLPGIGVYFIEIIVNGHEIKKIKIPAELRQS